MNVHFTRPDQPSHLAARDRLIHAIGAGDGPGAAQALNQLVGGLISVTLPRAHTWATWEIAERPLLIAMGNLGAVTITADDTDDQAQTFVALIGTLPYCLGLIHPPLKPVVMLPETKVADMTDAVGLVLDEPPTTFVGVDMAAPDLVIGGQPARLVDLDPTPPGWLDAEDPPDAVKQPAWSFTYRRQPDGTVTQTIHAPPGASGAEVAAALGFKFQAVQPSAPQSDELPPTTPGWMDHEDPPVAERGDDDTTPPVPGLADHWDNVARSMGTSESRIAEMQAKRGDDDTQEDDDDIDPMTGVIHAKTDKARTTVQVYQWGSRKDCLEVSVTVEGDDLREMLGISTQELLRKRAWETKMDDIEAALAALRYDPGATVEISEAEDGKVCLSLSGHALVAADPKGAAVLRALAAYQEQNTIVF